MALEIQVGEQKTLTANLSSGADAICTWSADRPGVLVAWSPEQPNEAHDPRESPIRNTSQLVIEGRQPGTVIVTAGTPTVSAMFTVTVGPAGEKLTITSS